MITNVTPPAVSGTPASGKTLTVSNGTWNAPGALKYLYQWERCDTVGAACVDVLGATTATYALTPADRGYTIRAVVTAVAA